VKPALKVVTQNDSDFMEIIPLSALCSLPASASLLEMNIVIYEESSDRFQRESHRRRSEVTVAVDVIDVYLSTLDSTVFPFTGNNCKTAGCYM
jgi:hypothetical protein